MNGHLIVCKENRVSILGFPVQALTLFKDKDFRLRFGIFWSMQQSIGHLTSPQQIFVKFNDSSGNGSYSSLLTQFITLWI